MPLPDDQARDRIEATFDAHYGAIAAYFRRRCRDEADADDATARVFSIAWTRLDRLPAEPDTRLWLYGVARRVHADHLRATRRRERLGARLLQTTVALHATDPATSVELADEVRAAWRALAPGDQEILALMAWEGLRVAEIARVLGVPAPLVSARLSRARRRLAHRLAPPSRAARPSRPPRTRPLEEPDHA